MKKMTFCFAYLFLIGNTVLFAQRDVDLERCLSHKSNGVELHNGKIVRINLDQIDIQNRPKIYSINEIKQLYLSYRVFLSLDQSRFERSFPKLKEIQIRRYYKRDKQPITSSQYDHLLSLPGLEKLTVEEVRFGEEIAGNISYKKSNVKNLDVSVFLYNGTLNPVLHRVQLKSLRLQFLQSNRPITTDDLEVILGQKNLISLSLVGNSYVKNSIVLKKLKGLDNLKELSLSNIIFNPGDLKVFPKLKKLNIRRCHFSSSGFQELFKHDTLAEVGVTECDSRSLKVISPLKNSVNSKLKIIKLSMIPVSDIGYFAKCGCELHLQLGLPGVQALSRKSERFPPYLRHVLRSLDEEDLMTLKGCTKLTKLSLGCMSEMTLQTLMELSSIPSLVSLEIGPVEIKGLNHHPLNNFQRTNLSQLSLVTYPPLEQDILASLLSPKLTSLRLGPLAHKQDKRIPTKKFWNGIKSNPVPNLHRLCLNDYDVESSSLALPDELLPPSLKILRIDLGIVDNDGLQNIMSRCPNLEHLQIHSAVIAQKSGLPSLREFDKLNSIELLNTNIDLNTVLKLKVEKIRFGGKRMFLWK